MVKRKFNRVTKEYELPPYSEKSLDSLQTSLYVEKEESKKKTFRIACDWSVYGTMEIEANSLEEAIKIAEDNEDLPTDTEYIDSSFQINEDMTNHFYKEDRGKIS